MWFINDGYIYLRERILTFSFTIGRGFMGMTLTYKCVSLPTLNTTVRARVA